MRKFIIIFIYCCLWSNLSFADHCGHDLDKSLTWKNNGKSVEWLIKNKTGKDITMTGIGVWASDNKTVMKEDERNYHIKPFGIKTIKLWVDDINLDVRGSFFSSCRYGKPYKVSTNNNVNSSSNSSSNNWGKKKPSKNSSGWFELLAAFLVVGGIAMMISKKSSRSTPKTYTENYKETYPETDNSDSSEIMPKPEIQRRYKIIAKFYNNYKFIDYGKIKNKKIAQKQMEDIVNVVDKNLSEISAGTANTPYRMLIVGMVTFKLLSTNQIKKVHKDLGKMYELGQRLQFDDRLMNALRNILDDNAGIDY